jgi:hypothetical protein
MNMNVARLTVAVVSILFYFTANANLATAEPQKPASCASPEYRQFDFWVGDWDVFEFDTATKVARVQVDRLLDGCALREQYEETNGLKGQSLSI